MPLLDKFSHITGKIVSWAIIFMVVFTVINVLASWLFKTSWIWLRESITWMHGANFLLACAFTLNQNGHVRVDVFYSKMSQQKKAIVNFLGTLLLLIPTSIFIAWASWPAFLLSWRVGEVSSEAGGLPAVYILKGFLLIMPILLIIEAINQLMKSFNKIKSNALTEAS